MKPETSSEASKDNEDSDDGAHFSIKDGIYIRKRDMVPIHVKDMFVRPQNSKQSAKIERGPDGQLTCCGYRLHEDTTPDALVWEKDADSPNRTNYSHKERSVWMRFPTLPAIVGTYQRLRDNGRVVITPEGRVHLEGKPNLSQPIEFREDGTVHCADYTLVTSKEAALSQWGSPRRGEVSAPNKLVWLKSNGTASSWLKLPARGRPSSNVYPGASGRPGSMGRPVIYQPPRQFSQPQPGAPGNTIPNFTPAPLVPVDPQWFVAIWRRKDKEADELWDEVMQGEDLEAGPELGELEPSSPREELDSPKAGSNLGSTKSNLASGSTKSRRDTISSLAEEEEDGKIHPEMRINGDIRGSKWSWYGLFFLVALILAGLLAGAGLVLCWVSEHHYVEDAALKHLENWRETRRILKKRLGRPDKNPVQFPDRPFLGRCCVPGCDEHGEWGIGTENGLQGGPVLDDVGKPDEGIDAGTHARGPCCHYYCTEHIKGLAANIREGHCEGCVGGNCRYMNKKGNLTRGVGQIEDHVLSQLVEDDHVTLEEADETMDKMDEHEPLRKMTRQNKDATAQASVNYVGAHAKPCSRGGCQHGITHYKYHACHSMACPCGQTTCFACGNAHCTCVGAVSGNPYHLHSFCEAWDRNGDSCGCLPCPDCARAERDNRHCGAIDPATNRVYCGECGDSRLCQAFIRQQRAAAAAEQQ